MKKFFIAFIFSILLFSCQQNPSSENVKPIADKVSKREAAIQKKTANISLRKQADINSDKSGVLTRDGLKLSPVKSAKSYDDVTLNHVSPGPSDHLHAGDIDFDFGIDGPFKLQKPSAGSNGQSIKVLLSNQYFGDFYELNNQKALAPGHYTGLAMLTDAEGKTIKSANAHKIFEFTVGHVGKKPVNPKGEHLFYVGPNGQQKMGDKILLDFYLVNSSLSANGNRVRATINDTPFLLNTWDAYLLEGLKKGENTIKLELLNADMRLVPGQFNTVSRKFTVS